MLFRSNLIGILIWYPIPAMRQIPLGAARLLGLYASFYRFVPALYIMVMFVVMPAILLGIAEVYEASVAGGLILGLLFVAAVGAGLFWWIKLEGCYKVLTKEQREERLAEVRKAEEEILGGTEAPDAFVCCFVGFSAGVPSAGVPFRGFSWPGLGTYAGL